MPYWLLLFVMLYFSFDYGQTLLKMEKRNNQKQEEMETNLKDVSHVGNHLLCIHTRTFLKSSCYDTISRYTRRGCKVCMLTEKELCFSSKTYSVLLNLTFF